MTEYDWQYDTWDAVRALDGEGRHGRQDASRLDDAHHRDWTACTLDEAREMARVGWEKGVAAIEVDGRDPVLGVGDVPQFEYGLLDEGSEVDVAAWLNGQIDCMGDMRTVPLPKPLVRIGVDLAVHANITSDQMLRVGRSVLVCLERLRAAGFPVEVDAIFTATSYGNRTDHTFTMRVRVQEAGQPIHSALLAFWVAHPAALRRAMFALAEELPDNVRDDCSFYYGSGYGHPNPGRLKGEYDEWAPAASRPEEEVTAWVRDVLSRHGLEGEGA